jgi:uncharacterized protein (DUF433 family)
MKQPVSKHIYLETDINELRFVATRIPVADALYYVGKGESFKKISEDYNSAFPPEAVAEAVALATKTLVDEFVGRKHTPKRARRTATA